MKNKSWKSNFLSWKRVFYIKISVMFKSMLLGGIVYFLALFPQGLLAQGGREMVDTLSLAEFRGIGLGINAVVYIRQGGFQQVTVRGPEVLLKDINLEVKDGIWEIRYASRMQASDTIRIDVVMKRISSLAVSGSGAIISDRPFKLSNVLELSLGGSGYMELQGTAPEVRANLAGSGRINAEGLEVQKAIISVAGAGEARLTVIQLLEASIAGSGKVWYQGSAQVKSSVAGSGFVRQIN